MTRKKPMPKAERMKRRIRFKEKMLGEVHKECIAAVDKTEAALILTNVGYGIKSRVHGDYILVDEQDIKMASRKICGLPSTTTQAAKTHQRGFYRAAEKYREAKRKDYREKYMQEMAEHWDKGHMATKNKHCYCGHVIVGRYPLTDCIRRGGRWDYQKQRCMMAKKKGKR